MLRAFERDDLGHALDGVLGRDVGDLERRRDEAVHGGDVDDPPQPRSYMPGSTSRTSRNGASTMIRMIRENSSGGNSCTGATC